MSGMFGSNKHKEAGSDVLMTSLRGLANMLAVVAAFILTPRAHAWSVDWVVEYVEQEYGDGFSDVAGFAWFVIVGMTIFFGSRATIGTALMMGALAIVTRMM